MKSIRLITNLGQRYLFKVPDNFPTNILLNPALPPDAICEGRVIEISEYISGRRSQTLPILLVKHLFEESYRFNIPDLRNIIL